MDCGITDIIAATDLPAAGITFLVLVWIFMHYQLKSQEMRSKERMAQQNGKTPPPSD